MSHIHRFFVSSNSLSSPQTTLTGDEAHHALRVVRVREGDRVILFDGQGREIDGFVTGATRHEVCVRHEQERCSPPPSRHLTILQASLHREKSVEYLIQRGTEIGVHEFAFFPARRSERRPRENDKWQRYAIEACKQCGRNHLPVFRVFADLGSALDSLPGTILAATNHLEPTPFQALSDSREAILVIGPEGDFASEELDLLHTRGARAVSLGSATFRSEVAAVLAASLVLYEWGLLGV